MTFARAFSGAGLALTLAADAFLLLADTYSSESCSVSPDGTGYCFSSSSSLIQENGEWVLLLLAVPTVLAGVVFLLSLSQSVSRTAKLLSRAAAVLFLAGCLVTGFSIGLFYLPAALACLLAVAFDRRVAARESPGSGSV